MTLLSMTKKDDKKKVGDDKSSKNDKPEEQPGELAQNESPNADLLNEISNALAIMKQHPKFKILDNWDPLKIEQAGTQAAFSRKYCNTALSNERTFSAFVLTRASWSPCALLVIVFDWSWRMLDLWYN